MLLFHWLVLVEICVAQWSHEYRCFIGWYWLKYVVLSGVTSTAVSLSSKRWLYEVAVFHCLPANSDMIKVHVCSYVYGLESLALYVFANGKLFVDVSTDDD